MTQTVYVITGSNRGLGRAFAATFLSRPSTTVIAAVRDPSSPTSQSLSELPKGSGSHLLITAYDAQKESAAVDLAAFLQKHEISHVDVAIANAGIAKDFSPIAQVPLKVVKDHMEVNAYGPILLFQALLPLLEKASNPKFVALTSPVGSIGGMEMRPLPMVAYGTSKAVLNYAIRKIHFEHPGLISVVLNPGFARTDMGNESARFFGLEKATDTVEANTAGMVKVIDHATRDQTSGHFAGWDGEEFPW